MTVEIPDTPELSETIAETRSQANFDHSAAASRSASLVRAREFSSLSRRFLLTSLMLQFFNAAPLISGIHQFRFGARLNPAINLVSRDV